MTANTQPRILGEPSPTDRGNVEFMVQVDGRTVRVSASPLGIGVSADDPLELTNAAAKVVDAHVSANAKAMQALYREAACLRKLAGNPPLLPVTRASTVSLDLPPKLRGSGAMFALHSRGVEIKVLIFSGGGLIDDCDDWDQITEADRCAAITTALDWVFANRQNARELGLDPDLLEELWR